jgi:hypothetical protein
MTSTGHVTRARKDYQCGNEYFHFATIRRGDLYILVTEFPGSESGIASDAGHPVRMKVCQRCAVAACQKRPDCRALIHDHGCPCDSGVCTNPTGDHTPPPPRVHDPLMTHDPCCTSHDIPMTCETYRSTHFVETRPCCSIDAQLLTRAHQEPAS